MRKYPVGLQDFRGIREGGFLYIDKTPLIHQLIESGKYYFLSRPRRFGKSLLLSTIREIFLGSKELFEGLWIADKWDWTQHHPVIHISFLIFTEEDLVIGADGLKNFDIADIKLVTLLFQTGYLTIKSYNLMDREYTLAYPNLEVKSSMLTYLVAAYTYEDLGKVGPNVTQLKRAFVANGKRVSAAIPIGPS